MFGNDFKQYSQERLLFSQILDCGKSEEQLAREAADMEAISVLRDIYFSSETKKNPQVATGDVITGVYEGVDIATDPQGAAQRVVYEAGVQSIYNSIKSCGTFNDGTEIFQSPKFAKELAKFKDKIKYKRWFMGFPTKEEVEGKKNLRVHSGFWEGVFTGQQGTQRFNALDRDSVAVRIVDDVPCVVTRLTKYLGSKDVRQLKGQSVLMVTACYYTKYGSQKRIECKHIARGYLVKGGRVNVSGESLLFSTEGKKDELFNKIKQLEEVKDLGNKISTYAKEIVASVQDQFKSHANLSRSAQLSSDSADLHNVATAILKRKNTFVSIVVTLDRIKGNEAKDILNPTLVKFSSDKKYEFVNELGFVRMSGDTYGIRVVFNIPDTVLAAVDRAIPGFIKKKGK